jgi:hypothetical protein
MRRKACEVLVSTVIVAVLTVTLFMIYTIIRNWRGDMAPGRLAVAFLAGIVFGLLTMGVYIIPCAFLISIVITSLKEWSSRAVLALLVSVVAISSIAAYVIDPTHSGETYGPLGYFTRFDWLVSDFNLTAILTGSAASLIAFWAVNRCRRRSQCEQVKVNGGA